ncbi:MAG: hypothetical protein WCG32_01020 [Actinomycetes bacterium]
MSTTTTGMRRFALIVPIFTVLTLLLASCSGNSYGSDPIPQTTKFVFDKFNGGEFLDAFTPDKPEAGITLEAMAQLSALGFDKNKQGKAIAWAKSNTESFDSIGLKATYVFTAHSLGFADDETVRTAATEVVGGVGDSGSLPGSNNFVYSWVIFALLAEDKKELANQVALHLSALAETDGGFKFVQGDPKSADAADVTAFALMAMKASLGTGDNTAEATKEFAVSKAKTWLISNETDGNHWSSYGDPDVSGSAYAIMALTTMDVDVTAANEWLQSRISPTDGGVSAPWTEPAGDLFSSAQSLLPLSKLSFIDVLKHKVN